jgi:indolepyruvate ferredoxin oxidoreductase beta subunit
MNARPTLPRGEPTSVLIAALGGQGGGVLTGWLARAARAQGLLVQATSTPGVSQRTGATTYYVEMTEAPRPGQATPAFALAPVPGRVDVLVGAELLETARMLERGMSTPSRTLVIASTHRVYTTSEKISGGDGRFDDVQVLNAARALARRTVMFDMEALRARHRATISAVLFGAIAGSGALPLSRKACEEAIRAAGIGVEPSLAAFSEAFGCASDVRSARDVGVRSEATPKASESPVAIALAARVEALPARVAEFVRTGIAQLAGFQDQRYAGRYVERVERIVQVAEGRGAVAQECARATARYLALWMAYDDLIRVAAAKSRASRFARIRRESGARDGDVVRVRDFFRPGTAEIAAILPRRFGAWLERRALASSTTEPAGRSLTLTTSSVSGALAMRMLSALRPLRRYSLRFAREQVAIDDWLALVERALVAGDPGAIEAALELAKLPRLLKGYGDTHATGRASFQRLIDAYRSAGGAGSAKAAAALRASTHLALANTECAPREASKAATVRVQPVIWLEPR